MIEGLREERQMTSDVQDARTSGNEDDSDAETAEAA